MRAFILFLTILSAAILLILGADMIQTADDSWDAFCGVMACVVGALLALVFVYFVAAGQRRRVQ